MLGCFLSDALGYNRKSGLYKIKNPTQQKIVVQCLILVFQNCKKKRLSFFAELYSNVLIQINLFLKIS